VRGPLGSGILKVRKRGLALLVLDGEGVTILQNGFTLYIMPENRNVSEEDAEGDEQSLSFVFPSSCLSS
jgi:hypothetical protein